MPSNEIQPVTKGQPISADAYNALLSECKRANKIIAASPLQVTQIPNGQLLSIADESLVAVGKAGSSIAALSSATPGSGSVTLWKRKADGSYEATTVTATALNFSSSEVAADTFLILLKVTSGIWAVIFESCPEE